MSASYSVPEMSLLAIGFVLYLIAALLGMCHLASRHAFASRFCRILAGGGVLAHGVFFTVHAVSQGSVVPVATRFEALIVVSSILVLAALLLDVAFRLPAVTDFALPLVTLILAAGTCLLSSGDPQSGPTSEAVWLSAHIALTLLSYAAFTLGFVLGIMYLVLERQLKAKRMGWLFDVLPPLEVVDGLSGRVVVSGFLLLTLGILLGAMGAHRLEPVRAGWRDDPKVVASGLTWVLYLITVLFRLFPALRGRRSTYLTVVGFLFILFTYFGAHLLGEGFHRY